MKIYFTRLWAYHQRFLDYTSYFSWSSTEFIFYTFQHHLALSLNLLV